MENFIGQVLLFAGNFAPRGWAFCHGQLLPIAQNQALFSLLGTAFGGDGRVTFGLPDLRGRVPVHPNQDLRHGDRSGVETVTVQGTNLPAHTHTVPATAQAATDAEPAGRALAATPTVAYGPSGSAVGLLSQTVSSVGGGVPVSNLAPSVAMNFIIALQGIYPARN